LQGDEESRASKASNARRRECGVGKARGQGGKARLGRMQGERNNLEGKVECKVRGSIRRARGECRAGKRQGGEQERRARGRAGKAGRG
jgi:hypothetical protein